MAQVPQDQWDNVLQKVDTLFWQFGNLKYYEPGAQQHSIGFRLAHRLDLDQEGAAYDFRNEFNRVNATYAEQLPDVIRRLTKVEDQLAKILAAVTPKPS